MRPDYEPVARPNAIEAPRDQVEAPSPARLHAGLPMVNAHRIAHEAEHWLLHEVPRLTASLAHSNPGAHCGAGAANDAPQEADHDTRQPSPGPGTAQPDPLAELRLTRIKAAPLRSAATALPAPRSGLRPRAGAPDCERLADWAGGSSALPDSPASTGTRRGRFASLRDGLRPPSTEPGRESPVWAAIGGWQKPKMIGC